MVHFCNQEFTYLILGHCVLKNQSSLLSNIRYFLITACTSFVVFKYKAYELVSGLGK